VPLRVLSKLTCPTSPCDGLSPSRTTIGAPSPSGFPPVGDPTFRAGTTFQDGLGALFVALRLAMPIQSPRAYSPVRSGYRLSKETSDVNHRIRPESFTVWSLGFKQSSFHRAARVSTGLPPLDGFTGSRLLEHASFPFGFRVQVGSTTQRNYAQPLPGSPGIVHAAMRRTNRGLLWRLRRHETRVC
jgi:hypothetical protein